MESKEDVKLLMKKMTKTNKKQDVFSESEDDFCTIKDDTEEFTQSRQTTIFNLSPRAQPTSFQTLFQTKIVCLASETMKKTNNFDVLKVSSNRNKNNVPRFGTGSSTLLTKKQLTKSQAVVKKPVAPDDTCIDPDTSGKECRRPTDQIMGGTGVTKKSKQFR